MLNEKCFYRTSIKGLVIDQKNRILLAHQIDDYWDLMGGGIEYDEEPIDALSREIKEETGLKITKISASPLYYITAKRQHKDTYVAILIHQIELNSLNFVASDECQELRFFSVEQAGQLKLYPVLYKFLDSFNPKLHTVPLINLPS